MLDAGFTAETIEALATGCYKVTRRAASTFVGGNPQPSGPDQTFSIVAIDVPCKGRELERLPQLRYSTDTHFIYTTTPLMVGGQGAPFNADLVTLDDGKQWEVQLCETWPSYFRAIVQVPE